MLASQDNTELTNEIHGEPKFGQLSKPIGGTIPVTITKKFHILCVAVAFFKRQINYPSKPAQPPSQKRGKFSIYVT